MAYIFDLDQTIVDSSIAEGYRKQKEWRIVYSLIPQFRIYEGIDEIFEMLHRRGERICVVTSSPRKYCEAVLRQFDLKADVLVCYHDTKLNKPYPDPIFKAVELLGERSEDVVSIGDTENDVIASKAAGVISCLALWGSQIDNVNITADYVFKTVGELKRYIV